MNLSAKVVILEQALRDIIDPVTAMHRNLAQKRVINIHAVTEYLASVQPNDPEYLRDIAKRALSITVSQCPHCNIDLVIGQSLPPTNLSPTGVVITNVLSGDVPKLIDVYKCSDCGYSETIDKLSDCMGIEITK